MITQPAGRIGRPGGLDRAIVDPVVSLALAEDLGSGDVTSEMLIDPALTCRAELILKRPGVLAGLPAAALVFESIAEATVVEFRAEDGTRFVEADLPVRLAIVAGPTRAILSGERTALNLLGRLSGIATLTRRFVEAVAGTGAVILDTRKTSPGLRALEKYAVRCGGGQNHRFGLYDAVLIKDNHVRIAGGVGRAVTRARRTGTSLPIEVEVESLDDVREALDAAADRILLDNMDLAMMRSAVELVAGRCPLEASGSVTLETVRSIAETGVQFISIGALTHSAPTLDVSLEVIP